MSISSLRHLSGGKITRRFWLAQLGALSLGTAACSRGTNQGGGEGTGSGSDLQLSFACVDNYDRTRPLLDGTVKPEGIVLQSQAEGPGALFRHCLHLLKVGNKKNRSGFVVYILPSGTEGGQRNDKTL